MDPRKDLAQAVQADPAGEVRDEDDVILVHAVVDEHAHRHERRPAAGHLRVQQQDEVVRTDVRGQQLIVELWLARPEARLDQQPAGPAVRNDALEARLQGGAAAEDDDGAYLRRREKGGTDAICASA